MGASLCTRDKGPPADSAALEAHRRIELEIKQDMIEERLVVKVLLLGAADSGKSTIGKQMRILHMGNFNETEKINYRYLIHTNFICCYHYVAKGIQQLAIPMDNPSEKELVECFLHSYCHLLDLEDEEQIKTIKRMGSCVCVKEACLRIQEFYVPDNTSYLFANASRILQTLYKPTEEDIVHARAATTGVHEIAFPFRRFTIRLIDVGGQKTERRKWIHCFDSVTAILFIASLPSYDQFMEEDPEKNRMEDSIELFELMYNNEFLLRASFILFLNKKDIFAKKINYSPLRAFFPAFAEDNNYERALGFLQHHFTQCQDGDDEERQIYTHVTNATDKKNINFVFGASCDILMQHNLNKVPI